MINLGLSREGYMRSMQWQLGMLGAISAFAYRHRETQIKTCVEVAGRRTFRILTSSQQFCIYSKTSGTYIEQFTHSTTNTKTIHTEQHLRQQYTHRTSTHRIAMIPTTQLKIDPGQLTAILTRHFEIQHVNSVTQQVRTYCMQFVVYFPTQFAVAL